MLVLYWDMLTILFCTSLLALLCSAKIWLILFLNFLYSYYFFWNILFNLSSWDWKFLPILSNLLLVESITKKHIYTILRVPDPKYLRMLPLKNYTPFDLNIDFYTDAWSLSNFWQLFICNDICYIIDFCSFMNY
jgi:hypothetical protein